MGPGIAEQDPSGRAGLTAKWKQAWIQQRLRLQPSAKRTGAASEDGPGSPNRIQSVVLG